MSFEEQAEYNEELRAQAEELLKEYFDYTDFDLSDLGE